jgi:hypothetical protein
MATYSSFVDPGTMVCKGSKASPLNTAITPDVLRRLNWMVNTYSPLDVAAPACKLDSPIAANTFDSQTGTDAGVYGPASGQDMQAAVWYMTGMTQSHVVMCVQV